LKKKINSFAYQQTTVRVPTIVLVPPCENHCCYFFFTMAQQPLVGQGLLVIED